MDIVLVAASIILETAFLFIALKSMKKERINNIFLFLGIIIATISSGILAGSVFRYLLVIILLFSLLKILYKEKARFYDIFAINIILIIKGSIEIIIFILIFKDVNIINPINMFFISLFIFLIPLIGNKSLKFLYQKIVFLWNKGESFYLRYVLCVLINIAIIFYYYIMVEYMKGVI